MKLFYFIFLSFSLLSSIDAGEVDPFYAVDKNISDSRNIINNYLNDSIKSILSRYKSKTASCENTALHVMQELGATNYIFTKIGSLNSELELWVNNNKNIQRVPAYGYDTKLYASQSIYAPKLKLFSIYPKDIDSTININGIYFGIDKLSHFLGSGYEYYKIYLEAKKNNFFEFMANFTAIQWGINMEKTILGLWAVGIFSYADLEANYQGFKMAKDFCNKSLLKFENKKWQLAKNIKMQDYVNPYWDEAYNTNSYTDDTYKKVRANMEDIGICKKVNWEAYHKRFTFYDNILKNSNSNPSRDVLNAYLIQNKSFTLEIYCILSQYQLDKKYTKKKERFR